MNFTTSEPSVQRIKDIKMFILGDQQMLEQSKVFVINSTIQSNATGSLLDNHLGSQSNAVRCLTCGHTKSKCQGHSGVIELRYPYIIPSYQQNILQYLKRLCYNCKILTSENKKCNICKQPAIQIRKIYGYYMDLFINQQVQRFNIQRIQQELGYISIDDSLKQLGFYCHPSEMIATKVFVSPPNIRPDKRIQSTTKNSDDFTLSLQGIAKQALRLNTMSEIDPDFDKIYDSFIKIMTSYHLGNKQESSNNIMRTIASSISGKEGIIRYQMLGKLVSKIGRAVTACDTSNEPDEVTLPLDFVTTIHMKETVRDYNYNRLLQHFQNGPDIYPGAAYITKKDGTKYDLRILNQLQTQNKQNIKLEEGDILHRHLINSDRIIVNRQPSLLQMSLGAHKIKVAKEQTKDTLDINVIAASQYNADFDGDQFTSKF